MHNIPCPVCSSLIRSQYMRVPAFHQSDRTEYLLCRCGTCGLIILDPRPSKEELMRLTREHFSASPPISFMSRYPRLRRLWNAFSGEFLAEFLSFSKGRVLDAGCGFGSLMDELAAAGCEPVGIEPNPDACEHCGKRGLNVICGVFERTGLPSASFDGAVLWHVIEHLPDPRAALAEIARLLKPGGALTIYCPNAQSYLASFFGGEWQGWDPPYHLLGFTPITLRRLVEESGFKIISMNTSSPEFFSIQSLARTRKVTPESFLARVPPRLVRSLPVRIVMMVLFRILDAVMPQRGECIRARLVVAEERK